MRESEFSNRDEMSTGKESASGWWMVPEEDLGRSGMGWSQDTLGSGPWEHWACTPISEARSWREAS